MRGAGPAAVLALLNRRGEMYGYELVEALSTGGGGALDMGQATLYPMLYNLEAKGLLRATWREAETGPHSQGKEAPRLAPPSVEGRRSCHDEPLILKRAAR